MNLTDSFAFASRKIAQTKLHKLSEALRRYYPVKSGLTTIHNFDGDLKICLDRASYLSSVIYWRGYNSTNIASFLKDYLRPDMTFVDVGANLGEVTLLAAKRLKKGRVLAFEPVPLIFSQLSRNIALNNWLHIALFNIGLFDQTGSLPMYRTKDTHFGTINEGQSSLFSTGNDREEVTIPLRRFDEVACEYGLEHLDVIKIDVEGAEIMVLRGAEASIKKFGPVIIIEMSEANIRRAGYALSDLIGYLKYLDYDIQPLDHEGGKLTFHADMICFPRSRGNQ
jgi:FkbM family methyltransferase